MRDSRDSDGAGLVVVLAVVIVLVLLGGGGAVVLWQRQQEAIMQRERAVDEAALARAVAEQRLAQATQTGRALPEQPNDDGNNYEAIEASIRSVLQSQ